MKRFKSFLAQPMEEYIVYRQNLGRTTTISHLRTFDRYLNENQPDAIILLPSFFLELRATLTQSSRTVNGIFSELRSFFKFMVRRGYYTENPLQDVPSLPEEYFIPFVFSPEQTDNLLSAVCKKIRKNRKKYLYDLSMYTAIMLLARCGLRINEPLRLLKNHYRREEKTLYIEKTKFKKDRLIPVPNSAVVEIENYLSVRKALLPIDQNIYLLAGFNHMKLTGSSVLWTFHRAVEDIGIVQPKIIIGNMIFGSPTPHSLRHAFAINTLKSIKDRGASPQHALPMLAEYMGHLVYRYTASYLKVSDSKDRQGLINFVRAHKYSS